MDIRNCKGCGSLYNYVGNRLCPSCLRKIEEKFVEVKEYVRENPEAGVSKVAQDTDVSVIQIQKWVKEERLILKVHIGSGIVCESCGMPIATGRYCDKCKAQVTNEIKDVIKYNASEKEEKPSTTITKRERERMRYLNNN